MLFKFVILIINFQIFIWSQSFYICSRRLISRFEQTWKVNLFLRLIFSFKGFGFFCFKNYIILGQNMWTLYFWMEVNDFFSIIFILVDVHVNVGFIVPLHMNLAMTCVRNQS